MISSSARITTPLARQALRQTARPSRLFMGAAQRRMASGTAKATVEAAKSDAPWAIGSVVIFGSMFVYLTSPPKGGKKGHGHEEHGHHDDSESDSSDSGGRETDDTDADEREYIVDKKIEDKPHPESDAPAGSHLLAKNSLSAEDGAHMQKKTKNASDLSKPDDITFQKGVSAAKEGHGGGENSHMSDPKKVVAAAHTERQDRKAKAQDAKDSKDSKKASEEQESKEVHESPQAADANAQNDNSEDEDEESQKIHDSENAKKANAINEEEGSDKAD